MTATEELGSAETAGQFHVASLSVRSGALIAPEGVNLAVRAGKVVALARENGAGKTTLTRAIALGAETIRLRAAGRRPEDFRPSISNV